MRRYGITASAFALLFFLAFPLDTSASGQEYVMTDGALGAGVRLEEARNRERAAEAGIGEAEDRAFRITESIGEGRTGVREAERAAQRLEDAGERAGELIAESQRILSGIRERAEKEE